MISNRRSINRKNRALEKANATIDELYDELEKVLQGGAVSPKIQAILESRKTSIYALGLSYGTCILLSTAGIRTVEALLALNTLEGLVSQHGLSEKSRDELISKMKEHGYHDWANRMAT